ncbi:hypothetical protein M7I_2601 [Glarea lozoyensis 74030]|uniref:Uncharacterized protein n=1 Tax=Glarea lozoyensis (strain ATCC 74030 / MF5533) TaxID=1104152 RepID=H0EJ99_GLAL7|nr:hypothetical protein M7I_2601 [Glarea lozoyensis 74030]
MTTGTIVQTDPTIPKKVTFNLSLTQSVTYPWMWQVHTWQDNSQFAAWKLR